jgi:hypothetical protein
MSGVLKGIVLSVSMLRLQYSLKLSFYGTLVIIIIIVIISFMQGICTYIPETNIVPREYTVAAILSLLFMVPN